MDGGDLMGYEIVLATFIGGIFSILSMLMWQHGTFKKMELQHKYNIRRFKLGQHYKLKAQELPKEVKDTSWMDIIKKLDKDAISNLLDLLPEEPEEESDILGVLADFAKNNPEIVNSFLSGLGKKKEEPPTDHSY